MHNPAAVRLLPGILFVTLLHALQNFQPVAGTEPFRMVACTMVRNDLPNLIEWIEFHIIQGVSHFYIYDDKSTDGLELLPKLYSGRGDYVTVIPVSDQLDHMPDGMDASLMKGAYPRQYDSFNKCIASNKNADWVMVTDTDEFIWSPDYDSMAEYLKTIGPTVTQITVSETRFGLGKNQGRLQYYLEKDKDGGVRLRNNNSEKVELTTEELIFRGPNRFLGEPERRIKKTYPNCASPSSDNLKMCEQGPRKSLVRPMSVNLYYMHGTEMASGDTHWAEMDNLRLYHFYLRSREDVELKGKNSEKAYPVEMLEKVNNFWTSIQDRSLQRFQKELKARVGALMTPSKP